MNLVADEGVDKSIVDRLRAAGLSVRYFAEVGAGADDTEVLLAANLAESLLLSATRILESSYFAISSRRPVWF
jgi:hypothetical protein